MRMTNYLYSFKEVVEELICQSTYSGEVWDNAPTLKNVLDKAKINVGMLFNGLPFLTYTDAETFSVNAHVENLWKLIKARYYNSGFIVRSIEITTPTDDDKKVIRKVFNNLMTKIALTYKKYDKLLSLYATKESDLLAQISSSSVGSNSNVSVSKRNESPQNLGDYSGDSHATEVSRNDGSADSTITTTSDKDTPIMRLAEIQNMYQDLLADWSNKMERCFIEEEVE
jgi:hypothetical protein